MALFVLRKLILQTRMRRLTRAFTGRLCDKYYDLMSWLVYLDVSEISDRPGYNNYLGVMSEFHIFDIIDDSSLSIDQISPSLAFYTLHFA